MLEEAAAIAERVGDARRMARARLYQGMIAHALGHPEQAMALYDTALRFLRASGDEQSMTGVLRNLADLAYAQRDLERAHAAYTETLAVARRIGHAHDAAYAQRGLGHVARTMGDLPAADILYRESLLAFRRMKDRRCMPFCIEGLACLASRMGAAQRAVRLFGAAQALRDAIGVVLPPAERADHEGGLAVARTLLDERQFTVAWQAGAALDLDGAVSYALEPLAGLGSSVDELSSRDALTRRELEVAGLVARGLTNRDIAAALVIAEGTAERHVSNILAKLGFNTRSQIAAWVAGRHSLPVEPPPRR